MADIFRKNNDKPLTKADVKREIAALPDPTEGPIVGPNGEIEDHPLEAIKFLEGKGVSTTDGSVINLLTPEEAEALRMMIKHGEFNRKESAFLTYLLKTSGKNLMASLEDCAVLYNELSPERRGKTQPPSKQFMRGKIQKILSRLFAVKGPRYGIKLKPGKTGKDIMSFMDLNGKVQRMVKKIQKKKQQESEKARREAMKEFWDLWKSTNALRREKGIPPETMADFQNLIDRFPNSDGSIGLKSRGEKVQLPIQSTNYKGGSDAIDRLEGRHDGK